MKNISTFTLGLFLLLFATTAKAQNNVGIGTASPDNSALVDMQATDKGVLVPRMDSTARKAIGNPADGLLVYDTQYQAFYYYSVTANDWLPMGASSATPARWSVVGTTDAIYTTNAGFSDMPEMTITFTPTKSTVYINASASGDVDSSRRNISLVQVRLRNASGTIAGGQVISGTTYIEQDSGHLVDDYKADPVTPERIGVTGINRWGAGVAWNISLCTPLNVTPGIPTTVRLQWSIQWGDKVPGFVRCNAATDKNGAHRSMMIWGIGIPVFYPTTLLFKPLFYTYSVLLAL